MSDMQKVPLPQRKKNRLDSYDYSSCGTYFITVCTAGRRNLFWESIPEIVGATIGRPQDIELSKYGKIVDAAIKNISAVYPAIAIDSYVIMPNHIHLLLRICADESGRPMVAPTVPQVVNQLKGYVSKKAGETVWQKSFHDHVIRGREDYDEIEKYIYENPMRWQYDVLYAEE